MAYIGILFSQLTTQSPNQMKRLAMSNGFFTFHSLVLQMSIVMARRGNKGCGMHILMDVGLLGKWSCIQTNSQFSY